MRTSSIACLLAVFLTACGSSSSGATDTSQPPATGPSSSGGSGGASAVGGAGGASAGGASGGSSDVGGSGGSSDVGGSGGSTANGGSTASGGSIGSLGGSPSFAVPSTFATYVELGDSISDGGGQGPFFYDLLVKNDDTTYPAWQGKDFTTKFGAGLKVVHAAKGGAVSHDVIGQVHNLPASLPGPVLVSITIGGNDMTANAVDILNGTDQQDRDQFRQNLSDALTELTMPGRFGAGVDVYVFEADIYDPSGGKGDFAAEKCPGVLSLLPMQPTDGFFGNWNAVVRDEIPKHGNGAVLPLHDDFYPHPISAGMDRWFYTDCIHPNRMGHHQLRRLFWSWVTGETPAE